MTVGHFVMYPEYPIYLNDSHAATTEDEPIEEKNFTQMRSRIRENLSGRNHVYGKSCERAE